MYVCIHQRPLHASARNYEYLRLMIKQTLPSEIEFAPEPDVTIWTTLIQGNH